MADLALSVLVNRDLLNLAALQCNDGNVYRASASPFMGEQLQWTRNQITSVYIDGAVTVNRQRQIVNEQMAFEVSGRNPANLTAAPTQALFQTNMATLIAAFSQDNFQVDIIVGTGGDATHYTYQAEAADVQVTWTLPRFLARQGLITFTVPRQPVPIAGGV